MPHIKIRSIYCILEFLSLSTLSKPPSFRRMYISTFQNYLCLLSSLFLSASLSLFSVRCFPFTGCPGDHFVETFLVPSTATEWSVV